MPQKQSIKLDPRVSHGTFILTGIAGKPTPPIAITSTPAELQTALATILSPAAFTVQGRVKDWRVEFVSDDQPLLIANGDDLYATVPLAAGGIAVSPVTIFTEDALPMETPIATPPAANAPVLGFDTGSGSIGLACKSLGSLTVRNNVVIRANASNKSIICVGNSPDTAAAGYILGSGETTPPIPVDNLDKVFLVGGAAGQGYSWLAT